MVAVEDVEECIVGVSEELGDYGLCVSSMITIMMVVKWMRRKENGRKVNE
jgi:hypothetical protein